MALQDIAVVSVPVSDQERARAFYVDRLGFELVSDDSSVPGMRWVLVRPRGGHVALTLVTWFESMPAGSLRGLVLRTSDIQADFAALSARGVQFQGPPAQQPWGTETVLSDPDGNAIVLQEA